MFNIAYPISNPVVVPGAVDQAVALSTKCAPAKNITKKVIDDEKDKPVNASKALRGLRKEVKTLTSILTTCSKTVASGIVAAGITNKQIVDFDAADVNNELAVEYEQKKF